MNAGASTAPIAVTMGEPGGIGGELTIKAWKALKNTDQCFYTIADPARLSHLGAPVKIITSPSEAISCFSNALPVLPIGAPIISIPGKADPRYADLVIQSIKMAVNAALDGSASAVVTNPIQKSSLNEGGFAFPGHTEFLGELTKASPMPTHHDKARTRGVVMMIASPALKTIPVTIHQSLRLAIETLTISLIVETVKIAGEAMTHDFGIQNPQIAISGLNPHAGESGQLGHEETEIVTPAIKILLSEGLNVRGPLPADTMFHEEARNTYDVAICMYHDQALIPAKTLAFDDGVNVTLGLPIVRTSPDHGTALDIAGKNLARPNSLIAAINLAGEIARSRAS